MSTNIVDVATFTSPVVVPTAGDLLQAATTLATAQGLANRTAFLNSLALFRSVAKISGSGALTSFATLNTGGLTDIPGTTVSVPGVVAGDILIAVASAQLASTGAATVGRLQILHSSPSLLVTQLGTGTGETTLEAGDNGCIPLLGYAVAGFTETYSVKIRGFDEIGTGISIRNNWSMMVFVLKV